MIRKMPWIGLGLVIAGLVGPATANAQCATELENLNAPDLEYMGLDSFGQRLWVGQEFATDCDGKFLTVSFLVEVQLFPSGNVTPLTAGDTVTSTVMDDQNRPIASVDNKLTVLFGLEWVEFDFGPLELGLAAGTLAVKISTTQDAYCRIATSLNAVPGQLMLGDEVSLNYISTRDAGFRITWDPKAVIVGVENKSWGDLKALYR
jgi:hypothetical protein